MLCIRLVVRIAATEQVPRNEKRQQGAGVQTLLYPALCARLIRRPLQSMTLRSI